MSIWHDEVTDDELIDHQQWQDILLESARDLLICVLVALTIMAVFA